MDSTFLSNWEKNAKNICYTKVIWGSHFSACKFSFTGMRPDLVIGCHLWPSCQEGLWTALTEVMWPATTGILRSCDLQHLGIWGHVVCDIWNTYCLDLGKNVSWPLFYISMKSLPGFDSASVSPATEILQQRIPVKMSPVSEKWVFRLCRRTGLFSSGNCWFHSSFLLPSVWGKALSLSDKDLQGPGNLEVVGW